jgi:hypothetical protein
MDLVSGVMRTISLGRAVLAAAALGAGVTLLAAACQQPGGGASGGTAASKATPTPGERLATVAKPTTKPVRPAPKATPAQPKPAATTPPSLVYMNALQVDAQHLVAANNARVSSCGAKDMTGCRAAMQQIASSAAALQKDLDAHPPPTCLKAADTTIRGALGLYLQGAQVGTKGIDEGSAAEFAQATGLLDQGAARFLGASDQLTRSGCTSDLPAVPA